MSSHSLISKLDLIYYPEYNDHWDDDMFRQAILSHMPVGATMLDLGAGSGFIPQMNFRGLAKRVCGLDPEESVLLNPYLDEAKVGFGESIPWPDNSFDLVFADNVLEHLPDPGAVFREVKRVLKPGGFFLAKTPNRFHYVTGVARLSPIAFHKLLNRLRGRDECHTFKTYYRANSKAAIACFTAELGLDITRFEYVEGRPEYMRICPILFPIGLAYERLVNRFECLSPFRVVLLVFVQKRAENKEQP